MKIQAHIFGNIVKLEEIKVAGFALRGTSDPLPLIGPSSSSSSLDLRIEGYICIHEPSSSIHNGFMNNHNHHIIPKEIRRHNVDAAAPLLFMFLLHQAEKEPFKGDESKGEMKQHAAQTPAGKS
nr:hypothetical protein Iba_chr04fCG3630 [Ipomoea batatas]